MNWDSTFAVQRANALAESLFALEEPWRSRFLSWVACRAGGRAALDSIPTQSQMADWLRDCEVYRDTVALFRAWQPS